MPVAEKVRTKKKGKRKVAARKESANGDDVSVLAPPGGEPKKEGSLISVKEAADSLDNTLVVGSDPEATVGHELATVPSTRPTSAVSRPTSTAPKPTSSLSQPAASRSSSPASRPTSAVPKPIASLSPKPTPRSSTPASRPTSSSPRPKSSLSQQSSPRPPSAISRPMSGASVGLHPGSHPGSATVSHTGSAASLTSERFRKNGVGPAPAELRPGSSVKGSCTSLQSKAAWLEGGETSGNIPEPGSTVARRAETDMANLSETVSEEVLTEMQHAYVPYLYARDRIARVTDDMKQMKTRHIVLVNGIETNYRDIERETQKQFTVFVMGLRHTYREKVMTFRRVIDVHRIEVTQKQQYWDNALKSLSMRNKQLLSDKKALLIQNKVEFDRLEKQKEEAVRRITVLLDTDNKVHLASWKKMVQEMHEKERVNALLEDEIKIEKETSETLQKEIEELKREPRQVMAAGLFIDDSKHDNKVSEKEQRPVSSTAAVIVSDVSPGDRDRMEEERLRMGTERDHMREERMEREREQESVDDERRGFHTERQRLQGELSDANQARGVREAQYQILLGQAGEAASLRAQYALLLSQFTVLGAIAVVSSDEDRKKVDGIIAKVKDDKKMMMEMNAKVEADIKTWETKYHKKHGRPPTEADRSDSVQEMFTQREEVDTMVAGLDAQLETLESLRRGEAPPAPRMLPVPIKDPEVKVVEVKVSDPRLETELETTQSQLERLRKQLSGLQTENTDLSGESAKLQSELSSAKVELARLSAARQEGEVQGASPILVAGVVDRESDFGRQLREKERELSDVRTSHQEELRAMEKKKKSVEMDVKNLLKEHVKQQKQHLMDEKKIKEFLNVLVIQVKEIHTGVAAASDKVDKRLVTANEDEQKRITKQAEAKQAYEKWEAAFMASHGHEPSKDERQSDSVGTKLHAELEKTNKKQNKTNTVVLALQTIKTGVIPEKFQVHPKGGAVDVTDGAEPGGKGEIRKLEREIGRLEERIADLEIDVKYLSSDKDTLQAKIYTKDEKIEELEQRLVALPAVAMTTDGVGKEENADFEYLMRQIEDLQRQVDDSERLSREEEQAHKVTRDKLAALKGQLQEAKTALENSREEAAVALATASAHLSTQAEQLKKKLAETEVRIDELEAERMKNIPVDAAKEIKQLKTKLRDIEKERNDQQVVVASLAAQVKELMMKLNNLEKAHCSQKNNASDTEGRMKALQKEKEQELRKLQEQWEKKEGKRAEAERRKIGVLEKKIRDLETAVPRVGVGVARKASIKGEDPRALQAANEKLRELKRENTELTSRSRQLEGELKKGGGLATADMEKTGKKHEKILKELTKQLDLVTKKNSKNEENLKKRTDQLDEANKATTEGDRELQRLTTQMATLKVAATEGAELVVRVKSLEHDVKNLTEENKTVSDNFNSERVLRKKYYNMVEDMKGKIRVYCRVRPMSKAELERKNFSVVKSPDDYTIIVNSSRGPKDFQYDSIFMPDSSQERVFEDTNNLVQSAVDGYNVCIFAYGQTGSGKTYTIIGGGDGSQPGIAPRAFDRIFELLEENKSKFSYDVTCYMLELYNDKLLDLFVKPGTQTDPEKMDIKKDKRGMVTIGGAEIKKATNAKELYALFDQGSKSRHTASTMMNLESSRSHLIISIVIETSNRVSGQVLKGKLSLVDLAGSERVGKTGASAQQLKEAMSINKSLSALGDVISALSSEQEFIPYRNNKLTMLMQDSLGGNAKTLMFVNVSPADYNADETVVSLTYASRVKLITNDAQKNSDNKEIARLKHIILKMKTGADVPLEEEV